MATDSVIAPFPADIGRNTFGHWVTGFTDGEGCFTIFKYTAAPRRKCPRGEVCRKATFAIALRGDDVAILKLIQSYFGCGDVMHSKPSYLRGRMNPWVRWSVRKFSDIADVIIPHYEKFPLRSRKAKDFEVWKQGVRFILQVHKRATPYRWSPEDDRHFESLVSTLKDNHVYKPPIDPDAVTSQPL